MENIKTTTVMPTAEERKGGMMKGKYILGLLVGALWLSFGMTAFAAPKVMADGTVFDAEYYAQANPDVVAALGTDENAMYLHYVLFGKTEGRSPIGDGAQASLTGSLSPIPVIIEPGDGDYLDLGEHFYWTDEILEDASVIDHTVGVGHWETDANGESTLVMVTYEGPKASDGFVRADYSSDPTYCAIRDYLLLQIAQAGPGKTKGYYPEVFITNNQEEMQAITQIYSNLNVDLYKSGLVRSIYLFFTAAADKNGAISAGYPYRDNLAFGFYK